MKILGTSQTKTEERNNALIKGVVFIQVAY